MQYAKTARHDKQCIMSRMYIMRPYALKPRSYSLNFEVGPKPPRLWW